VTKLDDKTKIHLVTDFLEPLTLHWALSKEGVEWLVSMTVPTFIIGIIVFLQLYIKCANHMNNVAGATFKYLSTRLTVSRKGCRDTVYPSLLCRPFASGMLLGLNLAINQSILKY